MRLLAVLLFAVLTIPYAVAQQNESQDTTSENAKQAASKKDKIQTAPVNAATPDKSTESGKPAEPPKADASEATDKEEHYAVAEVPPVICANAATHSPAIIFRMTGQ